jgi:hypothetical protein
MVPSTSVYSKSAITGQTLSPLSPSCGNARTPSSTARTRREDRARAHPTRTFHRTASKNSWLSKADRQPCSKPAKPLSLSIPQTKSSSYPPVHRRVLQQFSIASSLRNVNVNGPLADKIGCRSMSTYCQTPGRLQPVGSCSANMMLKVGPIYGARKVSLQLQRESFNVACYAIPRRSPKLFAEPRSD